MFTYKRISLKGTNRADRWTLRRITESHWQNWNEPKIQNGKTQASIDVFQTSLSSGSSYLIPKVAIPSTLGSLNSAEEMTQKQRGISHLTIGIKPHVSRWHGYMHLVNKHLLSTSIINHGTQRWFPRQRCDSRSFIQYMSSLAHKQSMYLVQFEWASRAAVRKEVTMVQHIV